MKSISSVRIAIISGFLLICHFCTFVSCQETQETCEEKRCTWVDEQRQCNCPAEVQRKNLFPFSNQIAKRGAACHHIICKSEGDPHFTTFYGNYYHFYKVGVYTLVDLWSRNLLIQAKQVPWNTPGQPSVNCGVMAREGNSIIGIIICGRASPQFVRYRLKKRAHSGSIRAISGGWKISLLSGIEIEIIGWEHGKFMQLHVKGLQSEYKQYRGLCSVTNVPHNTQCPDWNCDQYRAQRPNNLFSLSQNNKPKCGSNSITPICGCPNYPNCGEPWDITLKERNKYTCNKKRQFDEENAVFEDKDHIPDESIHDSEVVDHGLNMGYRFFGRVRQLDSKPVANVEDGRTRCSAALKLSPTYELCSSKVDASTIVESCALDENLMKEDGPAKSIATEFETVCLDNIRLSIETDANSQELKDLLAKVEKLVCPSQCSQNGKCVDSKCQCNEGVTGTDCSQRIGQAPVVKERGENSNCDDDSDECI